VTDELRIHWTLHEIDEEAAVHEAERAKLPAQRQALAARIATERARLEAHDARLAKAVVRRRELEREIASLEAEERRFRAQLDVVTNQQQFTAVQHEIAGVAGRRSDRETEALTNMDEEERAAAARPALADALARAEHDGAAAGARLDAEETRLVAAIAALDGRRAEAAAALEKGSRARYERLRGLRGGRAVGAIRREACGGCGIGLSPRALQEARKREALLTCDACGRLLLLPPEGHPES